MIGRSTHNWSLKLTALVLSIALWSHVRGQVNPWEVASFKVPLEADAPPGFVLQNEDAIPQTITVMLRGPRLTLRQLKGVAPANPLAASEDIPLISSRMVRAVLDVESPQRGEQKAAIDVEAKLDDIEVVGTKPTEVEVTLDVAVSKKSTVEPSFELAASWQAEDIELDTKTVKVSGASRALERIEKVRAVVREKTSTAGPFEMARVPLEAVDEDGKVVDNIRIEPEAVRVKATIMEQLEEKTIPIRLRANGAPAKGYELESMEAEPARATIRGPRRLLRSIEALSLNVDVKGLSGDRARRERLSVPDGVELVSTRRVGVRVEIGVARDTASPEDVASDIIPKSTQPQATATPVPIQTPKLPAPAPTN